MELTPIISYRPTRCLDEFGIISHAQRFVVYIVVFVDLRSHILFWMLSSCGMEAHRAQGTSEGNFKIQLLYPKRNSYDTHKT